METSVYWPSGEIVRFEVKVGVCDKFARNVTAISRTNHAKQPRQAVTYYTRLTSRRHDDDSVACKCAVTLVPDISVIGHFSLWARLVCRILLGCSGVSRVSSVIG